MALPDVEFLIRFNDLKERTKSRPQNLSWLCKNDDGLASLASDLKRIATSIARQIETKSDRYVAQVSTNFIDAYTEYLKEYRDAVETAATLHDDKLLEFIRQKIGEDPNYFDSYFAEKGIDPDAPSDFDVLEDNPVNLVYDIISVADSMATMPKDFRDDLHDEMHKALGAWNFFEDTVGIDLAGIYRRWKATPVTLVPKHVSDRHGLTEPGSLYDMLRQAHRAYVFGCERAAMALCRALLELVLKKHWGIEEDEGYLKEKQRRKGYEPGLEKIITIAEARHDAKYKLRKHHLLQKKELADDVLHAKRPPRHVSGDEVTLFLETLKFLIEKAPVGP